MLEMGRKCMKFKAFKTPRYLPGTVEQIVWKTDLVEYNKHRRRVFNMSSKVDDKPPLMNPHRYINSQRLAGDAIRVREMDKSNKEMIRRINVINRMGGRIDTFNPLTYIRTTQWRKVELFHQEVEKRNKQIYKIIKDAKSVYMNSDMTKFWNECRQTIILNSKFPPYFLKNKTIDQLLIEQPSICDCICMGIHQAERQMCFMDIRVKDGVYLGRIIIELYDDIVPVTVQNFLSLCTGTDGLTYKNCSIHKVIADKWLETGDVTKGNGKGCVSIYGDTFEEENFMLRHSKAGNTLGVLSTIPVRKCQNNSQFSITFNKMEALDGVRVVFGKIVKGNATLFQINDLGRKFGRPIAPIIVCDCGLFVKGKTLTKLSRFKYF